MCPGFESLIRHHFPFRQMRPSSSPASRLLAARAAAAQLRTIPAGRTARHDAPPANMMQVEIDGQPQQLAPGAQIRDADNRLVLPRFAAGTRAGAATCSTATAWCTAVWILSRRKKRRSRNRRHPTRDEETLPAHLRLPDERVRLGRRSPTCCARPKASSSAERPEDADLIVFNTCSVREKAQEKVFADLGRVKHLKRANPS